MWRPKKEIRHGWILRVQSLHDVLREQRILVPPVGRCRLWAMCRAALAQHLIHRRERAACRVVLARGSLKSELVQIRLPEIDDLRQAAGLVGAVVHGLRPVVIHVVKAARRFVRVMTRTKRAPFRLLTSAKLSCILGRKACGPGSPLPAATTVGGQRKTLGQQPRFARRTATIPLA